MATCEVCGRDSWDVWHRARAQRARLPRGNGGGWKVARELDEALRIPRVALVVTCGEAGCMELGKRRAELQPPSLDEIAACVVAHDLVELGRTDEARAMLARAPNRCYWTCPTCGSGRGMACRDGEVSRSGADARPRKPTPSVRLVPHLVRVHE